jgi:hypothetical protein
VLPGISGYLLRRLLSQEIGLNGVYRYIALPSQVVCQFGQSGPFNLLPLSL